MARLKIMENYTGEKGYLEGTVDKYEVVEMGSERYFIPYGTIYPFVAYRLVKNPNDLPRPLLFEETAVFPVKKRKTLIEIAKHLGRHEEFEDDWDDEESALTITLEEIYECTKGLT